MTLAVAGILEKASTADPWSWRYASRPPYGNKSTGGTPTALASQQPYPAHVAVDSLRVYWTNAGTPGVDPATGALGYHGGSVQSVSLGGGEISPLASTSYSYGALAVGHSVFLGCSDGQTLTLLECPLAGCGADNSAGRTLLSGAAVPADMVTDGDNLYFPVSAGTAGQMDATGTITKIVPGSEPVALASDIAMPCGIALNATYVFWTSGCAAGYAAPSGTVWRLPK